MAECDSEHTSGAQCSRTDEHVNHTGNDVHGQFHMWQDFQGRRGPRKYPKVGDNIRDFPEYK